jgi:hypothetical protein
VWVYAGMDQPTSFSTHIIYTKQRGLNINIIIKNIKIETAGH